MESLLAFDDVPDAVETDIQRVFTIANEILPRYEMPLISFAELRKIADGPFDLFYFADLCQRVSKDHSLPFNEAKRVEVRTHALEIARKRRFDVKPPDFISGIEESLKSTTRRWPPQRAHDHRRQALQHQAMEKAGIGGYFEEIVWGGDEETYYAKEPGSLLSLPQAQTPATPRFFSSGTAAYIRAGDNATAAKSAARVWKS